MLSQGSTRQHTSKNFTILIISVFFILFSGCAGKKIKTVGFEEVKAPMWVTEGSGAFENEGKRIFYGIGSATGIQNYSLLRTTSENRARNEVAKIFEVYTASLMTDYVSSTTAEDFDSSSEEQHVEQAIKAVVAVTLSGVEIVDHWEHPTKGIIFSLARLDLDEFGQNLDRLKNINSKVKEYVKKNAEKLHEKLIREEKKLKEERNS